MNKLGTKLGAIAMSAVMALSFAPSAAITSLAASGDDLLDATFGVEPVYRLYNPNSGEHLFTTDVLERDSLVKENWDNEGAKWNAPSVSAEGIYRLYNPSTGEHLYTSDGLEIAHLVNDEKWEEDFGGYPAFYAADDDLDPDAITINRFFNPAGTGVSAHIFSADPAEIKALTDKGYEKENGFGGYPLDYEPEEPVEELTVSIDNPTPKVGDTIKATLDPTDDKATYSWAIAGTTDVTQTSSTYKVPGDAKKGDVITLTVTLGDGKTLTATATVSEGVELPDDQIEGVVSIEDLSGLQTDGTALIGDTLHAVIPSTIGSYKDVVFYRDGKQLNSTTANLAPMQVTANRAGLYTVSVITNAGKVYLSDSISVVENEAPAKIISATIENDFQTPNVTLNALDTKAVITVKLNKLYDGTIYLYKGKDLKFTGTAVAAQGTEITESEFTGGCNYAATDATLVKSTPKVQTVAGSTAGCVYVYQDDVTGEATYSFLDVAAATSRHASDATTGLTRGEEYQILFDQKNITSDTPGAGKENKYEKNVTAPFLPTPAKMAIQGVTTGSVVKINMLDGSGAIMNWMDDGAGDASALFSELKVYSDTNADKKDGSDLKVTLGGSHIDKGVVTTDKPGDGHAFYYATAKTKNGLFSATSVNLASDVADAAQAAVGSIALAQNSDDPYSMDVTLNDQRAAGTIYIVRSYDGNTDASDAQDNAALKTAYDNGQVNAVGTLHVEKGSGKSTITSVIQKASQNANENSYIAVFEPDDTENFSPVWTDAAYNATTGNKSLLIAAKITSYKLGTKENTGATTLDKKDWFLNAYDQFGDPIASDNSGVTIVLASPTTGDTVGIKIAAENDTADGTTATDGGLTVQASSDITVASPTWGPINGLTKGLTYSGVVVLAGDKTTTFKVTAKDTNNVTIAIE